MDYAPRQISWGERERERVEAREVLNPSSRHALVREYVGEVITNEERERRTVRYAHDDLQHFYFMQLKKGEVSGSKRATLAHETLTRSPVHRRHHERQCRAVRQPQLRPQLLYREVAGGR